MADGNKYWFDGLPVESPVSDNAQVNWFDGHPVQWLAESTGDTLTPGLYDDTDTFFAPTVTALTGDTLLPSLVTDTDTFHAPAVAAGSVTLTPGHHPDPDTFHAPTVALGPVTLVPGLVTDTDVFFTPVLAAGPVTLLPGLVTDTDAFHAPVATQSAYALVPGHHPDPDTFHAPTVVPGAVSVLPGLVTDTDVFHAATLLPRTTLLPSLVTDTDTIHAATVLRSDWPVLPGLVTDSDTIFATTVGGRIDVFPPFVDPDTAVYSSAVSLFNSLLPALVTDTDTIFAPSNIARGPVTLRPPLVIDTEIFRAAIIGNVEVVPNPPGGDPSNLPGNIKYVSRVTMPQSGLIITLETNANATKTVNTRMVIYGETGGLPGVLRGYTNDKTTVVTGANSYTLITPVSVSSGENIWVGLHSDGNFNWFLTNVPGGSKYNLDTFAGGPSDPFGPVNNSNKKAPVVVYYLASANATITPSLVTDTDTFHAPALSGSKTLLPEHVTDPDSFYVNTVTSAAIIAPDLYDDAAVVFAPIATKGAVTLLPPLVEDDVIYNAFVSTFSPQVFSAHIPSDDVIYESTVTSFGANLPPTLVVDEDEIHVPVVVTSVNIIAPDLHTITFLDFFYQPTVTKSAASILPDMLNSGLDIYTPSVSVVGGTSTVEMPLHVDTDIIYAARKVLSSGWRRQVFIHGQDDHEVEIEGEIPTLEPVE